MPTFLFEARNGQGQRQTGTQDAGSAAEVVTTLRARGWLVLNVNPAPVHDELATTWGERLNPFAWLPPRSVDIELSLQQIAVMLRSGLTLLAALKTVSEQAPRLSVRRIWRAISERIQQGATLADAMAEQRCFSRIVLQLMRVGEATGSLELVMTRASESLEHSRTLKTQIITALAYPAIVLLAAVGVTVFMVVSVLPKLGAFLQGMGRRLPPMTQFLLDLSAWVQAYGLWLLVGAFALTVCAIAIYLWPPGRYQIDRLALRVPILGYLLRLGATVQFSQALMVLLESGITVVEGLRTVEQLHRNVYLAGLVGQAREAILRGSSLAAPLEAGGAFMPMLTRMVAVGEASGTLQEVLKEVTRFHENQLRATIRWLATIIEPAIIVIVGGIVGFVYIAFFVALFSVAGGGR